MPHLARDELPEPFSSFCEHLSIESGMHIEKPMQTPLPIQLWERWHMSNKNQEPSSRRASHSRRWTKGKDKHQFNLNVH